MERGYGIPTRSAHAHEPERRPARYLVIIDVAGSTVARLFLETREQVAEFDAGAEEVAVMTHGLQAVRGAEGPEWDRALEGHSAAERRAADVYTLDV